MLGLKVCAVFYALSSVIILLGFLMEYTSYSMDGNTVRMFGYSLQLLVCIYVMKAGDGANRRLVMSKELPVFEVATNVVLLLGLCLSIAGEFAIDVMGICAFMWVGVVGSSFTAVGGVMSFLKELWIEHLEEENQANSA